MLTETAEIAPPVTTPLVMRLIKQKKISVELFKRCCESLN